MSQLAPRAGLTERPGTRACVASAPCLGRLGRRDRGGACARGDVAARSDLERLGEREAGVGARGAAIAAAFPPTAAERRQQSSDVVVVSSDRYHGGQPPFRSFVARLIGELHATAAVQNIVTPPLVSRNGHAVLLPILVGSDSAIKPVVALAQEGSNAPAFQRRDHGRPHRRNDFDALSQSDLKHGELGFGLPAALVVLVLVFGAVVGGLSRC